MHRGTHAAVAAVEVSGTAVLDCLVYLWNAERVSFSGKPEGLETT